MNDAPTPPDARRRRWLRPAVAAASFALVIALAEAVLAVAGLPRPPDPVLSPEVTDEEHGFLDTTIYETDPTLLWRLRRNAVIDAPQARGSRGSARARGDCADPTATRRSRSRASACCASATP